MPRKWTVIKEFLGKPTDRHRPNSCPAFPAATFISPLCHTTKMKAREDLGHGRKHASYTAGELPPAMGVPKHKTIILKPARNETTPFGEETLQLGIGKDESEEMECAEYYARNIASSYGLGIVFVTSVDASFLKQPSPGAFATLLISYAPPGENLPQRIPAAMYQGLLEEGGRVHVSADLPAGFESGYSRFFGKGRVKFVFTCLARTRLVWSQNDLTALVEHAEWLTQTVTSQPSWI